MALEIFKLVGSIFVDNDKANESIGKTDKKAQGVGNTLISGIGKAAKWSAGVIAAAGAVATAVGGVSAVAIKSYANYEQLTGGVETLYGASYKSAEEYAKKTGASLEFAQRVFERYQGRQQKVLDNAKNAYITAGMSENEYMETVNGFAASLTSSLGKYQWTAANYADMIVVNIADNANKMGTSMESIKNAYQGFAKGQFNMLDNLKLGYGGTKEEMQRLLRDAEKLAGYSKGSLDINKFYNIADAIDIIQEEMGIAGTTAREGTSTIEGSINTIKAKLENLKTSLGASLAPTVQKFLSMAIEYLPVVENAVGQIVPAVSDLMSVLLPPAMQLISVILPMLISLFDALIPVASQILQAVLPILISLLQMLLPPLIEIINAILPLLISLIEPLLPLLQPILELLQPLIDLILWLIEPLIDLINLILPPLIRLLSNILSAILPPLKKGFENVADMLRSKFSVAFDYIKGQVDNAKKVFSGITDYLKGSFTGDWKMVWEGVKKIFSGIWDGIKAAFKLPINWIIAGINSFIRGINKIKIPDWVPGVGGKGFSIKTIPSLAQGGILEKGQTGFLEGNGAEAVVPLENNKKWIHAVAQDMGTAMGTTGRTESLLEDILDVLQDVANMKIYLDKNRVVGELAPAIDRRLGQLQAAKARG